MQVFGHRGSPGFHHYGENTITSFRRAIEGGADGIEFDVRRCGDGELIVIHDSTLDRTTTGSGLVRSLDYPQIRRFDAGHGDPVPLLATVLEEFWPRCLLNVELKESGLAAGVAEHVRRLGAEKNVVVSAFDTDENHSETSWEELAGISSGVDIGLLATPAKIRQLGAALFVRRARELESKVLLVAKEAVNRDLVDAAHEAGLAVRVFTVNLPEQVRHFASLGVDAIITDYPARSKQALHNANL